MDKSRIRYRGHAIDLRLTRETLTIRCREPGAAPVRLAFREEEHDFTGGSTHVFRLDAAVTPEPAGANPASRPENS